jgi:hypothetical protein
VLRTQLPRQFGGVIISIVLVHRTKTLAENSAVLH